MAEDVLRYVNEYLTWWEIKGDGHGPFPNDPDGGELRFVIALRDILMYTDHPDVQAIVRREV